MIQKLIDISFPVLGGTAAAVTQVPEVVKATAEPLIHGHLIIETVLVAAIGAMVGYIVKKVLDWIWPCVFKHKK